MSNYAVDQSRLEIMAHLQRTLTKMDLPDYTVPFMGDNHFYANSFTPAPFDINDTEVYFQDGRLYVDIHRLDGRIEGLSWKKNIFGFTERFGFSCEGSNGSMSLKIVMMPSWDWNNGKQVPIPMLEYVDFRILDNNKIDVAMWTHDAGPLLMDASIQIFKPIFIDIVMPILNGGMIATAL